MYLDIYAFLWITEKIVGTTEKLAPDLASFTYKKVHAVTETTAVSSMINRNNPCHNLICLFYMRWPLLATVSVYHNYHYRSYERRQLLYDNPKRVYWHRNMNHTSSFVRWTVFHDLLPLKLSSCVYLHEFDENKNSLFKEHSRLLDY